MTKTLNIWVILIFLLPLTVVGQSGDNFKIDTSAILANRNLDYFVECLKTDSFKVYRGKNAIPGFIKKQLNKLTKGFSIANPNQPYQCCCMSPRRLPRRQLIFLTKSANTLAMTYNTGGVGVQRHLLLIKFDNKKITDLWTGYFWSDITSAKDIAFYIEESKKRDFNTNMIYL